MNNTMVREIRGAKINPKSSFKKLGCAKYAGGANYASKYAMSLKNPVTPPGIDLRINRLVAQRLNHYATPGMFKIYHA